MHLRKNRINYIQKHRRVEEELTAFGLEDVKEGPVSDTELVEVLYHNRHVLRDEGELTFVESIQTSLERLLVPNYRTLTVEQISFLFDEILDNLTQFRDFPDQEVRDETLVAVIDLLLLLVEHLSSWGGYPDQHDLSERFSGDFVEDVRAGLRQELHYHPDYMSSRGRTKTKTETETTLAADGLRFLSEGLTEVFASAVAYLDAGAALSILVDHILFGAVVYLILEIVFY